MIPGFVIALATFPGVIVHEFAHKLFCILSGTKVTEVCYLRIGNPTGYVLHEPVSSVWKQILIGVGPFAVNTALGFLVGVVASRREFDSGRLEGVGMVLTWLGVSIAMHSFPSTGDAEVIWRAVWAKGAPMPARLIGTPLVVIIGLGALGSVFWLDFVYGLAVACALPLLTRG